MPGPVEIVLLDQPLHLSAALAHVSVPEAGGIALFVGTTRAERHAVHGMLVRLDYDAYPEMAQRQLGEICAAMRAKWPICRAAVHHRIGSVPVGEASVIVAVSAPHRDDAFAACRFLIDELKKSVPIWKREVYAETERWQAEE